MFGYVMENHARRDVEEALPWHEEVSYAHRDDTERRREEEHEAWTQSRDPAKIARVPAHAVDRFPRLSRHCKELSKHGSRHSTLWELLPALKPADSPKVGRPTNAAKSGAEVVARGEIGVVGHRLSRGRC